MRKTLGRASWALAAGAVLVTSACSSTPQGNGPTPRAIATPPPNGTPTYEVHEWGLVRGAAGDVIQAGAVAPPLPVEAISVDKPVLYFHADAPFTLADVSVTTPHGSILETWPLGELSADHASLAWSDVSIHPSSSCEPSALPSATDAPCSMLPPGSQCESMGLAVVRTRDAACVRFGDHADRFLFYRAESRAFTPPLRFARTKVYEDVLVTNDGDAPIPGVLVRIWTDGMETRTLVSKAPPPHGSAVIGHDFPKNATADAPALPSDDESTANDKSMPRPTVGGPGRASLRATMKEIGMDASEIDAFMRAWDATLFGTRPLASDRRSADGELAPRESFVYFLPEPAIDGIAKLHFDPPPAAVHRAFAVWSALRATGESR